MTNAPETDLVSYAMCEEVVERDAGITHFSYRHCDWWHAVIEGRCFGAATRAKAIEMAALDLQRRLERDLEGGAV